MKYGLAFAILTATYLVYGQQIETIYKKSIQGPVLTKSQVRQALMNPKAGEVWQCVKVR